MAKLYWRMKKNGKWTWRPAVDVGKDEAGFICVIEETFCDCGVPKSEIAPAWCSNHEVHNL
jgi:hypothetical protein